MLGGQGGGGVLGGQGGGGVLGGWCVGIFVLQEGWVGGVALQWLTLIKCMCVCLLHVCVCICLCMFVC